MNLELGVFGAEQVVRAEPIDAIAIPLEPWWAAVEPEEPSG
jgi:hypothetical protein